MRASRERTERLSSGRWSARGHFVKAVKAWPAVNGPMDIPPPPPPPAGSAAPHIFAGRDRFWPDWEQGPRASTRALQAVILGGATAGALWGNGVGSIGTGLWLTVLAVLVVAAPARRDRLRTAAAVAAVVFAGFLALRASPWLIPLNATAAHAHNV